MGRRVGPSLLSLSPLDRFGLRPSTFVLRLRLSVTALTASELMRSNYSLASLILTNALTGSVRLFLAHFFFQVRHVLHVLRSKRIHMSQREHRHSGSMGGFDMMKNGTGNGLIIKHWTLSVRQITQLDIIHFRSIPTPNKTTTSRHH